MNEIKFYKTLKIISGIISGSSCFAMYILAKLNEAEYITFKVTTIYAIIAGIIAVIAGIGMWFFKENEKYCRELYEQEEHSKAIIKKHEDIPWYKMTIDR